MKEDSTAAVVLRKEYSVKYAANKGYSKGNIMEARRSFWEVLPLQLKEVFPSGLFFLSLAFLSCSSFKRNKSDYSKQDQKSSSVRGQSLPGTWRPFADNSPWNTPITPDASIHTMSAAIVNRMSTAAKNVRFGNYFIIPIWVVNADRMSWYAAKSAYPFDTWDNNNDFITDISVPIDTTMWGEQTADGHMIVIDTLYDLSWEMSRFKGIQNGVINSSTFNVWDLKGIGVGDPNEGKRWKARGGRAAGFPNIAGIVRPEEVQAGEIRHALAFTFSTNRKDVFYYPAARTDGRYDYADAPAEGMLFQLNPSLTDQDFTKWGLSDGAKVVALALQKYGMYLCDNGGDMALQLQLLDKNTEVNRKRWDDISPGLYSSVSKIPTDQFRLINTGEPLSNGNGSVVTTPLIIPQCGTFKDKVEVKILVNENWANAVIRYTLDGSTPSTSSLLYTAPFTLTASKTIKARAFHKDGKDSYVMRAPIIIK